MEKSKPTRTFDLNCPTCGVDKGERCRDDEGNFVSYHPMRFELALATRERGGLSDDLYESVIEDGGYFG